MWLIYELYNVIYHYIKLFHYLLLLLFLFIIIRVPALTRAWSRPLFVSGTVEPAALTGPSADPRDDGGSHPSASRRLPTSAVGQRSSARLFLVEVGRSGAAPLKSRVQSADVRLPNWQLN